MIMKTQRYQVLRFVYNYYGYVTKITVLWTLVKNNDYFFKSFIFIIFYIFFYFKTLRTSAIQKLRQFSITEVS